MKKALIPCVLLFLVSAVAPASSAPSGSGWSAAEAKSEAPQQYVVLRISTPRGEVVVSAKNGMMVTHTDVEHDLHLGLTPTVVDWEQEEVEIEVVDLARISGSDVARDSEIQGVRVDSLWGKVGFASHLSTRAPVTVKIEQIGDDVRASVPLLGERCPTNSKDPYLYQSDQCCIVCGATKTCGCAVGAGCGSCCGSCC